MWPYQDSCGEDSNRIPGTNDFRVSKPIERSRASEHMFVLTRRLEHPRFDRIEMMTPRCYVHHFTLESIDDCDAEVQDWLCEAYKVGSQERLFGTLDPQSRQKQ
jgi:hypothetical protein